MEKVQGSAPSMRQPALGCWTLRQSSLIVSVGPPAGARAHTRGRSSESVTDGGPLVMTGAWMLELAAVVMH